MHARVRARTPACTHASTHARMHMRVRACTLMCTCVWLEVVDKSRTLIVADEELSDDEDEDEDGSVLVADVAGIYGMLHGVFHGMFETATCLFAMLQAKRVASHMTWDTCTACIRLIFGWSDCSHC